MLHPHRYLDLIQSDAARIATVAPRALRASVPCCAGWDVAEVVRHTGSVYNHKVAIMRLGRAPEQGEWQSRPPADADLVAWFDTSAHALLEELAEHDLDDWAYTWWPSDHTIGFWYRRMALESVVHRVDVEQATGDLTSVDAALSREGVEEVLTVFLGVNDVGADGGPTGAISVETDGDAWIVHLDDEAVRVAKGSPDGASARIRGEPADLMLYLWGRGPLDDLDTSGDAALVQELRRRLAAATQ